VSGDGNETTPVVIKAATHNLVLTGHGRGLDQAINSGAPLGGLHALLEKPTMSCNVLPLIRRERSKTRQLPRVVGGLLR